MSAPRLRTELLEDRAVPALIGALDPSFSPTAPAGVTDVVAGRQFVDVAVQQDGKIVAVSSETGDFFVTRFLPNGDLDTAFGTNGVREIDIQNNGQLDSARAVAIDAQNRIVVVGSGGAAIANFALVRLDPNGKVVELNTSFHVGNAGDSCFARDVAFQTDGTIVLAGDAKVAGDRDFAMARVSATTGAVLGAPLTRSFGGNDDIGRGVAVFQSGPNVNQIAVVGNTGTAGDNAIGVLLARADLTDLVAGFNAGTVKTIDPTAGNDLGAGVAITASGSIVIAGHNGAADRDLVVAQLLPTGALDPAFNGGAVRTLTKPGTDTARSHALALSAIGEIVVIGDTADTADVGLFRLNPDGSVDPSFGPGGDRSFNVNGDDDANAVAIDNNGRILIAGDEDNSAGFIARITGSVEKPRGAAAVGTADGKGVALFPDVNGQITPVAIPDAAFGGAAGAPRVATADVNGDGFADGILVTGPGTAIRVTVISGVDQKTVLVAPFDPFGGDFTGGGYVAAGDFDQDGKAEFVITPDQGGGPRVSIFSRNADGTVATRQNFFGIDDPNFRGGARAAVGDVNGDGVPDLAVAAGFGGGPRIALFDGKTAFATAPTRLVADFFSFPEDATTLRNGSFVAIGDVSGDGSADLIFGGGPGGSPRVFVLSGALVSAGNVTGAYAAPILNFFVAGNEGDRGGVRLAAADLDGDNKADVLAASGEGRPAGLRAYLGRNVTATAEPTAQDVALFGAAALPGGVFVG